MEHDKSHCFDTLGGSFDLDLFTVHSGRRLIYTACLLSGYGMFGEMIRLSENNRQMGRLRYLYSGKLLCANLTTTP